MLFENVMAILNKCRDEKFNDVVIFGEVDDIATTRKELDSLLEKKYKNNGFLVTAVNEYIHGMAVDNVQIIHA